MQVNDLLKIMVDKGALYVRRQHLWHNLLMDTLDS